MSIYEEVNTGSIDSIEPSTPSPRRTWSTGDGGEHLITARFGPLPNVGGGRLDRVDPVNMESPEIGLGRALLNSGKGAAAEVSQSVKQTYKQAKSDFPKAVKPVYYDFDEQLVTNPDNPSSSNIAGLLSRVIAKPITTFTGEELFDLFSVEPDTISEAITQLGKSSGIAGRLGGAAGHSLGGLGVSVVDTGVGWLSDPWKKFAVLNGRNTENIADRLIKLSQVLYENKIITKEQVDNFDIYKQSIYSDIKPWTTDLGREDHITRNIEGEEARNEYRMTMTEPSIQRTNAPGIHERLESLEEYIAGLLPFNPDHPPKKIPGGGAERPADMSIYQKFDEVGSKGDSTYAPGQGGGQIKKKRTKKKRTKKKSKKKRTKKYKY